MVERMQEQIAAMAGAAAACGHSVRVKSEAAAQATKPTAPAPAGDEVVDGISTIKNGVNDIFSTSSFQDATSRRVRRAIGQLQQVDLMLNDLGADGGARPAADRSGCGPWSRAGMAPASGADLLRVEIDRLMAF